jgi:iron complex outermembrane receptor protein
VPLGTVTWEQTPSSNPTDLFVTYRNFGDVDLWGADLGLTLLLTDELSFTGSYSYVSDNFFAGLGSAKVDSIGDIALNAPRNKGTLAGHYRNQRLGIALELRGRYIDSYPVNSGVFVGRVPSFTLVDANINYTLPIATATQVALTVNNIFDDEHQEMVGAPFVGRMAMLRVTQSF